MRYAFFLPLVLLMACGHSKKLTSQSEQLFQQWVLSDINGVDVSGLKDTVTIDFNKADGRVAGKAACNRYFGTFKVSGQQLSFSPLGATQMYCGEETMKLEDKYLKMMEKVDGFKIDNNQLIFLNSGNEIARFDRNSN